MAEEGEPKNPWACFHCNKELPAYLQERLTGNPGSTVRCATPGCAGRWESRWSGFRHLAVHQPIP